MPRLLRANAPELVDAADAFFMPPPGKSQVLRGTKQRGGGIYSRGGKIQRHRRAGPCAEWRLTRLRVFDTLKQGSIRESSSST
jgi:hypothetical protein